MYRRLGHEGYFALATERRRVPRRSGLARAPPKPERRTIESLDAPWLTMTGPVLSRSTRANFGGSSKDRLAPYKYQRAVAFIAELPKTETGKIQRFRLREKEPGAA